MKLRVARWSDSVKVLRWHGMSAVVAGGIDLAHAVPFSHGGDFLWQLNLDSSGPFSHAQLSFPSKA